MRPARRRRRKRPPAGVFPKSRCFWHRFVLEVGMRRREVPTEPEVTAWHDYPAAVRGGGFVFISGVRGGRPDGEPASYSDVPPEFAGPSQGFVLVDGLEGRRRRTRGAPTGTWSVSLPVPGRGATRSCGSACGSATSGSFRCSNGFGRSGSPRPPQAADSACQLSEDGTAAGSERGNRGRRRGP